MSADAAPQPNPTGQQLENLLQSVAGCLEAPGLDQLVVCQKHLLRVIDLLQTARRTGTPVPPATRTSLRRVNTLRRQAETLLTRGTPAAASNTLAYRRDGTSELNCASGGSFEMEL